MAAAAEMKLEFKTDVSSVETAYKATQANINTVLKQLPRLAEEYKKSLKVEDFENLQKQFDKAVALIDRGTKAVTLAHPEIDELATRYKFLTDSVDSFGREFKGIGSDAYNILKQQQEETQKLIDLQKQLAPTPKENLFESSADFYSGLHSEDNQYNAMGKMFTSSETYEEMWSRLLKEQDEAIAKQKALTETIDETSQATQSNINKILREIPKLAEAYNNSLSATDNEKMQVQLNNAIALIQRATSAVSQAHPEVDELTTRYKFLTDSIEFLGREYKGMGTEAYEVLKNLQQETQKLIEAQNQLAPQEKNLFEESANFYSNLHSGDNKYNAMGKAYSPEETYEQMWSRLLDEQDEAIAKQEKLTSAVASTGKATSSLSKLFSTTFNVMQFRVIMNVINSVARLKDFLADSTKAAAEAEQVFSKLNTVFGQTSNSLAKASSLATKLGVATSTAASSLSTVGDLLQAQGMTTSQSLETAYEWASQFQDIIAFKDINMSLEEFAQNFMSGAAGNLRNFRTFGSIVRESAVNAELAKKGLDKLSGAELELAKMTTRAEMALEQQKNAMGATQREWDTMLSINRRYEESLKSLKENTGEALKPITKWWTELKTSIVESLNAQMEYNKLMETMKSGQELDAVSPIYGNDSLSQSNLVGYYDEIAKMLKTTRGEIKQIENIIVIAAQYGIASNAQALDVFTRTALNLANVGSKKTESIMNELLSQAKFLTGAIEKNTEANATKNKITTDADKMVNTIEKILELKGASVPLGESVTYDDFIKAYDNGDTSKLELYTNGMFNDKNKLASDFVSVVISEMERWGNSPSTYMTEKEFGEISNLDILEEVKESLRSMYDIMKSGNFGSWVELEAVYKAWEKIGERIEAIEKDEERKSQTEDAFGEFGKIFNFDKLAEVLDGAKMILEYIGESSFGEFFSNIFDKLTNNVIFEKVGDFFSGIFEGIGSFFNMEDIYSILLEILAQTELFQQLSSILTDSILPVLDAFLKPLLPVVKIISDIITSVIVSNLASLWPILKIVSKAVVVIASTVEFIATLVEGSIKWFAGQLVSVIYKVIDAILWGNQSAPEWAIDWAKLNPWNEANKVWDKMSDSLDTISKTNFEIADNTAQETDFETLKNLFLAKEITESQYQRLTKQDRYTLGTMANGVTYSQGSNRSYISVNSLIVQTPDGMTLEEFLHNSETFIKGQAQYA